MCVARRGGQRGGCGGRPPPRRRYIVLATWITAAISSSYGRSATSAPSSGPVPAPPLRGPVPASPPMEAAIKIAVDIAGADAGDSGGTLRHSSGCRQPPSDLQFSNTPCVEWQQDDWMAGTDSFCNSFPAVVHSVFSVVATSQDSTLHDKSKRISTPLVDKYSINVNIIF